MLSFCVNRTPHPRPGNADITIGGFPPLRQYHLAFRPKPTEASAIADSDLVGKAGPPLLSSFCLLVSAFSIPQPFCFDTLTDSPTQRQPLNPFLINHFRTLFIATAGVPPNSQKGTRLKPDRQ